MGHAFFLNVWFSGRLFYLVSQMYRATFIIQFYYAFITQSYHTFIIHFYINLEKKKMRHVDVQRITSEKSV